MKRTAILSIVILALALGASAQLRVRFHNEQTDTTKITQMLIDLEHQKLPGNEAVVAAAARALVGTPYMAHTLEADGEEMLTVDMDELDCTTLVETALAMAMTLDARRTSWRDYVYYLRQLRYRGGEVNGYASRLHYVSDWIVDNNHRGNLQEVTDRIANANYQVKTLDYMSSNASKYPALSDEATLAGIKNAEIGYRSHRYPFIKPSQMKSAQLKEGDVVALTTGIPGLDVSHLGIIVMEKGVPHLLHASSKEGRVVIDKLTFEDYLRRNHKITGFRIIRLK